MPIGRKIAYNVVINTGAKVASTALSLVGIGMLLRYLGQAGFGAYSVALTYFALFIALADFGLYHITTREIGRRGADENFIVRRVFALRLVISGIVLLLTAIAAWFLPYEESVRAAIVLMAVAFFFSSSYGLFNGVFQKHLAMDRVAITEFFGKLVQVLWFAAVIRLDAGFLWIVGGVVAAMVFNATVILFLAQRYVKPKPVVDIVYWRKFLHQSLPMGVSAVIGFLYFRVNVILMSLWLTKEEIGIYSAASKVMENLVFFPAMVMGLMLPILSRTVFTDKRAFTDYADKTLKVFALLITPLVVGVWFTAGDIMHVIGGGGYESSAAVLKVLILALLFIFFSQLFTTVLIVANLQKTLMFILAAAAAINIVGNIVAIRLWSYQGAAFVTLLTELFVLLVTAVIAYVRIKYRPHIPQGWRILTAGAIMGAVLFFLPDIGFVPTVIAAAAVYASVLMLSGAVRKNELREIFARNSSLPNTSEI